MERGSNMEYTTYDSPGFESTSTLDPAASGALGMGTIIFFLIMFAVAYVVGAWLLGRIFKKAGVESWKAWVPVYNNWVTFEIGGQKGFWSLFLFIPFVNIVGLVFYYIALYQIGLKLGKSGAFVLLAIFLPIVWFAWLAFDSSTWGGQVSASPTDPPYQPPAPVPAPGTSEQPPAVSAPQSYQAPQQERDQNNYPPNPPLVQ